MASLGEIDAVVSDAVHGPFDWLWVQHDIDTAGPTDVNIVAPLTYIKPTQTSSAASSATARPSPRSRSTCRGALRRRRPAVTPHRATVSGSAPGVPAARLTARSSSCVRVAPIGGATPVLRQLATLTVDAVRPAIALSAATQGLLADNRLLAGGS